MKWLNHALRKLKRDRSGITTGVISLIVGFVVIAVGLSVGLMVIGSLDTTTDAMDLGATGNTTRDTLFSNIYTGFDLTVILPIVADPIVLRDFGAEPLPS